MEDFAKKPGGLIFSKIPELLSDPKKDFRSKKFWLKNFGLRQILGPKINFRPVKKFWSKQNLG